MTHILVCTDGSIYANSVYDHASWAAERTGASVELLHVIDHKRGHADSNDRSGNLAANGREGLLAQLAELDEQKSRVLQAHGWEVLEAAKIRMKEKGIAEPKLSLRHGNFIDTVADVETSADLVVIGKRGEAADFASLHLGANLERVIRGSKHPVLVTSRAFKPVQKVLIAWDGGPSARKAVKHAAEGKLLKDLDILLFKAGPDNDVNRADLKEAASQLEAAGQKVRTLIKDGDPELLIVDTVKNEEIDLLVVGAYGHSRIRQLIIGSTTTSLIRTCKVPLLMFR